MAFDGKAGYIIDESFHTELVLSCMKYIVCIDLTITLRSLVKFEPVCNIPHP